jgi:hypothetical protein
MFRTISLLERFPHRNNLEKCLKQKALRGMRNANVLTLSKKTLDSKP